MPTATRSRRGWRLVGPLLAVVVAGVAGVLLTRGRRRRTRAPGGSRAGRDHLGRAAADLARGAGGDGRRGGARRGRRHRARPRCSASPAARASSPGSSRSRSPRCWPGDAARRGHRPRGGGGLARGRHGRWSSTAPPRRRPATTAIWFLIDVGDADVPVYVVVSAQGRYLVDGAGLSGGDRGRPAHRASWRDLSVDELSGADRRVAPLIGPAAIIPRCHPDPSASASPAPASSAAWRCARRSRRSGCGRSPAVGLVGLDRLIADQPVAVRFRRGWLVAMGCFVPSLIWMTALTAPGYLIACVLYAGMLGAGVAAAPPGRGRWLALAGTWTLAELLRWTWPFGGVPLGNLAYGQVAGPLAPVLRVGGSLLLLLVTVLVGQAVAAAVRRAWRPAVGLALGARSSLVLGSAAGAARPRGRHRRGGARAGRRRAGHAQDRHRRDRGVRAARRRDRPRRAARRPGRVAGGRHRHRRRVRGRPVGRAWSATWPRSSTHR